MALDYAHVMGLRASRTMSYDVRDTLLYALGVGFGGDPVDPGELPFVYEQPELKAAPTMACILAGDGGLVMKSGVNYMMMVHGEQRTAFHAPLPAKGALTAQSRVAALVDKGEGRGAILVLETVLLAPDGTPVATVSSSAFCRGDGGFGGPDEGAPVPHPIPDRAPDQVLEAVTRPDQALLYRLSGDYNPLHADPALALKVGFPRPILHGLCTYGVVGRQVLAHACGHDPARLKSLDTRFSSPVFPGETLVTELWRDGPALAFRAKVKERDQLVLNNGRAIID